MKKLIKIFFKLVLGIVLLVIIILLAYYYNISRDWKKHYTENEMRQFASQINSSRPLSNNFYHIHDALTGNDRHRAINSAFIKVISHLLCGDRNTRLNSWHVKATFFLPRKEEVIKFPYLKLGYALENFVSSEKCFDFTMNSMGHLLTDRDSSYKDISLLSDTTEILKYLALVKSPTLYKLNPQLLENQVQQLKMELEKGE